MSTAPVEPAATSSSSLPPTARREAATWGELTSVQKKSGLAAWLGWLFDGLDMHLYTLVATPFVAELLHVAKDDPAVKSHASWIMAAFLIGWAFGGAVFGRIGDRLGRSRALILTILTYSIFTGASYFAQTWWQLMIFRFLAALGIGGEWAVGASLLSETWPKRWRPWIAAVLQTAVNVGIIAASLAYFLLAGRPPRDLFLIGVLPALLVLWIRRAVPEPEEWHAARAAAALEPGGASKAPGLADLFRGDVRRTTVLAIIVCAFSLSAHWSYMYFYSQHLRSLPDVKALGDQGSGQLVSRAMMLLIGASIAGNFIAALIARRLGYRGAITLMCCAYCACMAIAYGSPRPHQALWVWLAAIGACQGLFGLFTMYLPPLFPVLLRTTGAGFCYNIGRIAAAAATVIFGTFTTVGDYRVPLFYASFLFLPAALAVCFMSEPADERPAAPPEPDEEEEQLPRTAQPVAAALD